MGGSQLKQLKAAIQNSGIVESRGKKRKRGGHQNNGYGTGAIIEHRDKRAQKLDEIQKKFNTFDIKVEKLKYDVGGRKLKGTVGKPGVSKQVAIERRKNTLLVEYEARDKVGGLVDRRFGENDPTMSLEEKMLARFTKERQRASKGAMYNLEDQDELTHFGQSLSQLDDFDNAGLTLDDDDEEEDGRIDAATVKAAHFGGFSDGEAEEDDGPPRKKSKVEVMAEVIAKSKEHKYARQLQKEQDESTRQALDEEFDSIRGILFSKQSEASLSTPLPNNVPSSLSTNPSMSKAVEQNPDKEYDKFVRELATDKKSQPKDRTKTEEEIALEEKEALELAEKRRLRRMMGETEDSDDNETDGKKRRPRDGDDLDDDFMLDEDQEQQTELRYMLGTGLQDAPEESPEEDDDDDEMEDNEEKSDGDEEDEEDDTSDEDEDEFGPSDEGEEAEEGDLEDLIDTKSTRDRPKLTSATKLKSSGKAKKEKEIPFTFPCPSSHSEFLDIMEDIDNAMTKTVIERIRKLHHPSLHLDNKSKLQAFIGVLLDHAIYCASQSPPRLSVIDDIYPHIYNLSKAYPIQSAEHFISKLNLLQKNLTRGLQDPLETSSKTFPGLPELTVLRLIGLVWSTSDLKHSVVSPARILMGAYLGLGRVRSLNDIASGLYLCSLFMQYEKLSQRLVPEAINFIVQVILLIAPSSYTNADSVPGCFPIPDFESEHLARSSVRFKLKKAGKITPQPPSLSNLLSDVETGAGEQPKLDLLVLSLELIRRFADMYKSLDGFIELYEPILSILRSITLSKLPTSIHPRISELIDVCSRLLKFAHQARNPLLLQAHKPIPIATYVPKFEAHHSSYMRTKNKDPDAVRAELTKLKALHRKEKKGAMRELRKDNRFLAEVQRERQEAKDREYKARMSKVFAGLESERAEQRKEEKEKRREKRRANKK